MASPAKKIFCIFQLLLLYSTLMVTEADDDDDGEEEESEDCDDGIPWSYSGSTGPKHWAKLGYKDCKGSNQSPIVLPKGLRRQGGEAKYGRLAYCDGEVKGTILVNDGRKVKLVFPEDNRPGVDHGFVQGIYELIEIHIHIGNDNNNGTEHVFKEKYGMEMQAICKDSKGNISSTIRVFEFVDEDDSMRFYQPIFDHLHKIRFQGQSTVIDEAIDFRKYFKLSERYTYDGSLTSPPCTEGVFWIFGGASHGEIYRPQMKSLRKLYSTPNTKGCKGKHKPLFGNNRPIQPLNGRPLFHYFEDDFIYGKKEKCVKATQE